jgi:hypothetical protein
MAEPEQHPTSLPEDNSKSLIRGQIPGIVSGLVVAVVLLLGQAAYRGMSNLTGIQIVGYVVFPASALTGALCFFLLIRSLMKMDDLAFEGFRLNSQAVESVHDGLVAVAQRVDLLTEHLGTLADSTHALAEQVERLEREAGGDPPS